MLIETKVNVQPIPGRFGRNVFIYRPLADGSIEVFTSNGESKIVRPGYGPDNVMEPTFYLPDDEMIQGLLEALIRAGGKVPDEGYLKGKNEALETHLGDMRRLIFDHDGSMTDLSKKSPG